MVEVVKKWVVEHLDDTVDNEFSDLPKDIQAKFLRLAAFVEEFGLLNLHEPYVKHLKDKLWELRVKAKSGLGRGMYCTMTGKRVVVLRYFMKTSAKTPPTEIAIALQRMQIILSQPEVE